MCVQIAHHLVSRREIMQQKERKKLLNIKELSAYLGIGQTKARELVRGHNGFGLKIGNRWYADRSKLDKWIDTISF